MPEFRVGDEVRGCGGIQGHIVAIENGVYEVESGAKVWRFLEDELQLLSTTLRRTEEPK